MTLSIPQSSIFRRRLLPFFLLFFLLLLVYLNSFTAEWHLDDNANIVNNQALHIQTLMPESLGQTLYASPLHSDKLYRPLAYLSFGVNWFISKDNPFGYHFVNFGFHAATAMAIYFLFVQLLAVLHRHDENDHAYIQNIALLAAVLWAINPIQTQAVTYIVQRMAVMTAFFYVLAILCYVKARTETSIRKRWAYGLFCGLWFLCAFGSKENAVMLPFSLVLVEWIFFQRARTDFLRNPATWFIAAGLAGAVILSVLVATDNAPIETMQGWYNSRPFTLEERLMTQPRILLGYLSQIFYPLPERFSIAHDVRISKSLLSPWTTLPALAGILSMIAAAFLLAKRHPLLSFSVLFFFLNHAIESSIFPIELVFEHRNYLPSLFLFLPIAAALCQLLEKYRKDTIFIYGLLAVAITVMITAVGLSTYSRNTAWATETSLWTDAAQKAPNSIRPLVTLGIKLAWQDDPSDADYELALALFRRALDLPEAARKTEKAEILGNIASIYYHRGNNRKAIEIYQKAVDAGPKFLKNRSDMIKPLIIEGEFDKAARHCEFLLEKQPDNPDYLQMMGFIRLWQDKPQAALARFQKALTNGPHHANLFLNTGVALTRLESWDNGRWFLSRAMKRNPGNALAVLAMIENRARAGDNDGAAMYARRAVSRFPAPAIHERLGKAASDYRAAPILPEYIAPFIENEIKTYSNCR